jgi:hypothetical protein
LALSLLTIVLHIQRRVTSRLTEVCGELSPNIVILPSIMMPLFVEKDPFCTIRQHKGNGILCDGIDLPSPLPQPVWSIVATNG